eukprot:CAMPEP_0179123908 /NCGR_PEP_ID=MMETSP0796-20121207/58534_1 /TAXON_ID=73915 /ORGANISM="Pyrodinium bahamense, Strain pbaha01" /LENGTH=504 /DNA_ID=CAMNT_0020822557 /DNA_START=58 /DNA_END=1570 /DNA_ORIENTATION=+
MPPVQRRLLVIGGGFAGLCVARDLRDDFLVTVVDAKEFFEYTPGILRAYVKPEHLDHLTFTLHPVIEEKMGCKYIWGEVTELNGPERTATIKPMFSASAEVVDFDFCIIASGCNFGPFHKWGESLWFPTVHEEARPNGSWPHLDERFLEGRRRHIVEEYESIKVLNEKEASILVVGAGFIGVEWVTELAYFFPKLKSTIIDFLPMPLGPLPPGAAKYCKKYMKRHGIAQFYNTKYAPDDSSFWPKINLPSKGADKQYICIGVKASNYFMPKETLSEKGPGGGGWILMDMTLAVETREGTVWSADEAGYARIYAIGDCNAGGISQADTKPEDWPIPPIPKISYPGEEEAVIACKNVIKIDKLQYRNEKHDLFGNPLEPHTMHWPWGAGMFATSLGPHDACFVLGANWEKGSGYTVVWGRLCALQKWIIEASKVDECKKALWGGSSGTSCTTPPSTSSAAARAGAIEGLLPRVAPRGATERGQVLQGADSCRLQATIAGDPIETAI